MKLTRAYFKPSGGTIPIDPTDFDTLLNATFDHRSNARTALNVNNSLAQHGEEILSFPELSTRGGTAMPMYFAGSPSTSRRPSPNATRKKPLKVVHPNMNYEATLMQNEASILYGSTVQINNNIIGCEVQVITHGTYTLSEAFKNSTYIRPYFAEGNESHIRVNNDGSDAGVMTTIASNKPEVWWFEFVNDGLASAGRVSVYIYKNNVRIDEGIHHETYLRTTLVAGFGTDTNCAFHLMHEEMSIYGRTTSDEKRTEIYNAIASYYGIINQEVPLPYARNITMTKSGNIVTCHYDFYSPTGKLENKSTRDIRVWLSPGGIQAGYFFDVLRGSTDSKLSVDISQFGFYIEPPIGAGIDPDYPQGDSQEWYLPILPGVDTTGKTLMPIAGIRFDIRVVDEDGKTFWLPQALFKQTNNI